MKRIDKAILASIKIGGKIFCFHDYTYVGAVPYQSIFEWGYSYLCTKCGKEKIFKNLQIEPLDLIK